MSIKTEFKPLIYVKIYNSFKSSDKILKFDEILYLLIGLSHYNV